MLIPEILPPQRVLRDAEAASKKRVLEMVAESISASAGAPEVRAVLEALLARERLGSTALGYGVALPHARLAGIERAMGVLMTLRAGVDFESPDGAPVDLVFGLVVPEASTEEHLEILASLAERFSDERLRRALREAETVEAARALFAEVRPGA